MDEVVDHDHTAVDHPVVDGFQGGGHRPVQVGVDVHQTELLVIHHVDGVGELVSSRERGDARELWFRVPGELARFVAEKGSICVDGVSLTINEVEDDRFAVGLIPHTLSVTTLGKLQPGSRVNLEVDVLARYIERLLAAGADSSAGLSFESLRNMGY